MQCKDRIGGKNTEYVVADDHYLNHRCWLNSIWIPKLALQLWNIENYSKYISSLGLLYTGTVAKRIWNLGLAEFQDSNYD